MGERDGITFVDDALASNPFATAASLEAFTGRQLTLIVGGADRGVDPSGLVAALAARRPAPRVIVLPPEPGRLVASLAAGADTSPLVVEEAADLEDAGHAGRWGGAVLAGGPHTGGGGWIRRPQPPVRRGRRAHRPAHRRRLRQPDSAMIHGTTGVPPPSLTPYAWRTTLPGDERGEPGHP